MLGGRLYVGGGFYHAGDVPASNVASWDPATGTWSAVGSVPTYDGDVFALAALDDRYLVVGGYFSKLYAGRFQVSGLNSLVLFDTHAAAGAGEPVGGLLPAARRDQVVAARGGQHAAGARQRPVRRRNVRHGRRASRGPTRPERASRPRTSRSGTSTARDGNWSTPGGTDRQVKAFATLDGRSLVVGGGFGSAGSIEASAVVEHDPATGAWTPYGSGIGWGSRGVRQVEALAQSPAAGCGSAGRSPSPAACPTAASRCGAARRVAPNSFPGDPVWVADSALGHPRSTSHPRRSAHGAARATRAPRTSA